MNPMKLAAGGLALAFLASCSATGDFVGSPNGYAGVYDGYYVDLMGAPTRMPDGSEPSSSVVMSPNGTIVVTGNAADRWVLGHVCTVAPQAALCRGDQPAQ